MTKRVTALGVLAGAGLVGALVAHPMAAEAVVTLSLTKDYTASPWTTEVGYRNQAVGKLGFGLKNLLLGWTDLITEPRETLDAGGNILTGLGVGLKDALENTLGGVVHTVTFFLPQIDAPLPEGGTKAFSA